MSKRTMAENRRSGGGELAEAHPPEGAVHGRYGDEAEVIKDSRILDFISGTAELKGSGSLARSSTSTASQWRTRRPTSRSTWEGADVAST